MPSFLRQCGSTKYTLIEPLEEVAIIGVLVAISIPIFTSQLEKAREATDAANLRSAYAVAAANILTDDNDATDVSCGPIKAVQADTEWTTSVKDQTIGNVPISSITPAASMYVHVDNKGQVSVTTSAATKNYPLNGSGTKNEQKDESKGN